jgi:YidC/Oxa1 family membrane protein insertase
MDRQEAIADGRRIRIKTPKLQGQILLTDGGVRLDDATLLDYRQTAAKDSPDVEILSPSSTAQAYFVESGLLGVALKAPGVWQIEGDAPELTPETTACGSQTMM